jgi:signal transduction histidine kinase
MGIMRRPHSLRSRLFSWFFGAIVLTMGMSGLVVATTRPEPITGAEVMARTVAVRLAATWDDPQATHAYVDEVRDVTGFDVHLVRDPRRLPWHVHRVAARGAALAPDGPEHVFVPVMREGRLEGALEMQRFGPRPVAWGWWRFGLALLLVVVALSTMAGAVANQLARPLEHLAQAADRFGAGDLAVRTDQGGGQRRWVANEVRGVALSFNRMADRIEAMVRGQRELLAAISHELRSPLGRARVALEIARDRLPPASQDRDQEPDPRSPLAPLDDVEKQLGAVDAILGDLLDVSRTGLADLRKEPRDLVAWLRERIAQEPPTPAIVLAGGDAPIPLELDPALLGRAVQNLFVNARAHGHPADAPIEVRVTTAGDRVLVVVRDRGHGFPEGFAERAFEPFVRAEPSRARPAEGAGYGLGLTLVRRIVEAHGGKVFARNAPATGENASEGGAEVEFELPLSRRP